MVRRCIALKSSGPAGLCRSTEKLARTAPESGARICAVRRVLLYNFFPIFFFPTISVAHFQCENVTVQKKKTYGPVNRHAENEKLFES